MKQPKLAILLGLAGALAGCGSKDDDDATDPTAPLIGTWTADIPGSPGCIFGGTFNTDGVYEADTVCPLADGSYGVEAEVGNFGADGKVIDFVPTAASCLEPDRDHSPSSVAYTVSKTTLRLVQPSGAVVFSKHDDDPNSPPTASLVIHFGCANADGFVYSDIQRL